MPNGESTHEWRISQLEERMKVIEGKIQGAVYILVANMIGIISVLARLLLGGP